VAYVAEWAGSRPDPGRLSLALSVSASVRLHTERPDRATLSAMTDIPVVQTERLVLRAFRPEDLDDYAAMCADAEVMRYIGDGQSVGRDMAWRQMAAFLGHWALRGYGMWAVEERASGRLVGRAGYLNPEGWPALEIGWLLGRTHWGRGLALEAAQAALVHGRAHVAGIGSLISLIRPENRRSAALARRLGAQPAREIDFLGGPTVVYTYEPAA
jgi:RimJ/RimL family protein N-acetyltransferase